MANKYCSTCGAEKIYRKGISKKSGRPWAGWFCSDRTCDSKPEWVRLKNVAGTSPASLKVIGETLAEISKEVKLGNKMLVRIGKMMKSQLPEAPDDAQIPTGEPPPNDYPPIPTIPIVEDGHPGPEGYDY
jgi:hypothetical protein